MIERLLDRHEVERVPFNKSLVESLLAQSEQHTRSAELLSTNDPTGAFELAYDAMRKTATALLAAQGLRPTSAGGHIAVQEAVTAQFGGGSIPAFRSFNRLRRVRNDLEYPDVATPLVEAEDVIDAVEAVRSDLDFARQLLDSGQLTVF